MKFQTPNPGQDICSLKCIYSFLRNVLLHIYPCFGKGFPVYWGVKRAQPDQVGLAKVVMSNYMGQAVLANVIIWAGPTNS